MDAGTTIPGLFLRTVERHGSRPAIIGRERALSYDQCAIASFAPR